MTDTQAVRVAFFVANGQKNGDLWRNPHLRHVFLGHGDSDKATSATPIARLYDQVWVAGRAGIDRYRAAGIDIPEGATAIHGAELPETPSTTTASAPRPSATHWAGRRRSCSRPTPSSTVTSGLR